eukprot:m.239870 g.239870  ORF g.239870 m.239870 type:complete len:345 (+) comp14154_c0_seq1:237-1271(+)
MKIGVIGGSGLYNMPGLEIVDELDIDTPYGKPSGPFAVGTLDGVQVVFLARHGPGHVYLPTEVNYAANIWGMKKLGVEWIISVSAVGSLREEIVPGHVVLIDQFIDRTHHREHTFFGRGFVGHVSVADPICSTLHKYLLEVTKEVTENFHEKGTYVNMEGPAFSTRAESNLYRSWDASVIGMTCLPEARLCREAEISYAVLAMATDYDCWYEGHDDVSVDAVIATLQANVRLSQDILRKAVVRVSKHEGQHPQEGALKNACMTQLHLIPKKTLRDLEPIISKYFEIPSEEEVLAEMGESSSCCGCPCKKLCCGSMKGKMCPGKCAVVLGSLALAGYFLFKKLSK